MVWWRSLNYYLSGLHIFHLRIFAFESGVQMAVSKSLLFHFKTKQIKKNFGKVARIAKHLEVLTQSFFWISQHSFAEILRIFALASPWIVLRCYAKLMEQGKAWRGDMGISDGKVWRWKVIFEMVKGGLKSAIYVNIYIYQYNLYVTNMKLLLINIWSILWKEAPVHFREILITARRCYSKASRLKQHNATGSPDHGRSENLMTYFWILRNKCNSS